MNRNKFNISGEVTYILSGYIPYTDEQITRANQTDIPAMLRSIGHKVKREGANWRWASGHDSLMIKGCEWYRNSTQTGGGGVVNFCKQYLDMDFKQAMEFLLHGEHGQSFPTVAPAEKEPERHFELPKANRDMRRVFAYLTKERCINPDIVSAFVRAHKIYEDLEYHNVVFVGHDEAGAARFACKRGTNSYAQTAFRRDVSGSDKRYGFNHIGTSGQLYVFEAPIDMLSHISMHKENWQQSSYIALGGVSDRALTHFLGQHPDTRNVCLCLDNDTAGCDATLRIGRMLERQGYEVGMDVSHCKDWNQELVEAHRAQSPQQVQIPAPKHTNAPAFSMKMI